jgi:hypothetical protein
MIGRGAKNLPKEAMPPCTGRSFLAVIAWSLIIVTAVNVVAWWYLGRFTPNTGYLLIRAKWEMLTNLKKPVDLLILGDSSGNQGVDPDVLRDSLDVSSVNLCTIGDALVLNDVWMLEEYLARYGSPKGVLIVHSYDMWSRDMNISVLSKIPGDWWHRKPELSLSFKDRIRVYLNRYAPLYAETASLGWLIQHPWAAFQSTVPLRPDGFMVEPTAAPAQVEIDADVHRQFVRQQSSVLSGVNRAALKRIMALAAENRFDIYLAGGPIHDSLAADAAFQAYYMVVQDTLGAMASSSSRVSILQKSPLTFPAGQMQSADHVAYPGAVLFTAQLAHFIKSLDHKNDPPPRGPRHR